MLEMRLSRSCNEDAFLSDATRVSLLALFEGLPAERPPITLRDGDGVELLSMQPIDEPTQN
jgi:hypothetical protein